jgi:chromosome segregation ATPase
MTPSEYQQLVEFLGQRFEEIDGRFAQIDRRFTELHDELAELRREMLGHFDALYRRLERLEQEHQAIVQALRRIEAGLADERGRREILERDLAVLKQQMATVQARIEEIEERLGRRGD